MSDPMYTYEPPPKPDFDRYWGESIVTGGQKGYMRIKYGTSNVGVGANYIILDVPKPPTGLAASPDASLTDITLSWTDNSSNETWYSVERSNDGSTGWTPIAHRR